MRLLALLPFAVLGCSDTSGPNGNGNGNGNGNVPSVGDIITLNIGLVADDADDRFRCTAGTPDARGGRVVAVTATTIVVVDTANPSGGLTDQQYASFASDFDTWGYSVVTETFGEPEDLDENERVIAFFTRAVNELTKPGDDGFIFGLFWPGDLFPTTSQPGFNGCPASNYGEIFYIAVADPNGVAGPDINGNAIRRSAVTTMGHEFQHLVNASRRMYVNPTGDFEVIWLNEGLSHITEELMFFRRTGAGPGINIDIDWLRGGTACVNDPQGGTERICAFNQFQVQNFSRFAIFLEDPDTEASSLVNPDGALASRGVNWHFLRYAADRRGSESEFWNALVNTNLRGLPNLTASLGADAEAWIRDWSAAVYADDANPATPAAATFQFPSWNLRDIYPAFRGPEGDTIFPVYPLQIGELTDADPVHLDIAGMAAAYLRVVVPAAGTANVTLSSGEIDPPEALRLSIINTANGEVVQRAGEDAGSFTLEGGAEGATYVLAALHVSTTAANLLTLDVQSDGAALPVVTAIEPRAPATGALNALTVNGELAPLPAINHQFHIELLERARIELQPRVAHARAVYREQVMERRLH